MTLREVVNYLLQSLGIGQIDHHDRAVLYKFSGPADTLTPSSQLVFRTVERSLRWLKRYGHFTFEQSLTDDDIQMIYDTFLTQVKKAETLREQENQYWLAVRREALERIEGVIEQHQYLRQLLRHRTSVF